MRNIVILNSLHFSYPLPILMRVSYNTLIVKQNTSDYYKYSHKSGQLVSDRGKSQFFMLSVASPLEVRWESMKALCLVSEICLLYFVLLPFHQVLSLK